MEVMSPLLAMALTAVVLKPAANMYSKPDRDSDVVSQAIYGANVDVVEDRGEWKKIRTADDYTGWTPSSWLRAGARYAASGRVAEVASLFANLYREPDVTKHEPVIVLPFEARLEVVSEPATAGRRWIEARLAGGGTAWVQRGDVRFDAKPLTLTRMLEFSKRFLGLPYLWGGTSTLGYDCSGYAQMLYRQMGFTMPRDAQPQADWSGLKPVQRSELQPGDLLYFGSSDRKIGHTGIYIGRGEFINATTHESPMIRIDRLDDPAFGSRLVASRRLK
jgi:gamma-D-glutamyl-L-lysine dipeptidyl-peptidase